MLTGFKTKKLLTKYAADKTSIQDPSCVSGLKEIGEDAVHATIEALQQQKIPANKAQFLFNEICDKRSLKTFIPLIGDPYDEVRRVAKDFISKNWDNSATSLLIKTLKSDDAYTRLNATRLLTSLRPKDYIVDLISLFNEATPETKECVIKIVSSIGGIISTKLALSALNDESWQVRQAAVQCLCTLKDPESIPTLLEILTGNDPQKKMLAMEALYAMDYRDESAQILTLLTDKNLMVREGATDYLIRGANKEIAPDIIKLMHSENTNIRRCAIEILKNINAPDTTKIFMRALKDPDWWVRQMATSSLTSLHGDSDITRGFISLTRNPDKNLRRCAVEFFNNAITPEAFHALIERLTDEDDWVREKALRALSKLEDKRAITPIVDLIDDPKVGPYVPKALAKIGGEPAIAHLINFLMEKPKKIKLEAIKALGKTKNKNATDAIKQCLTNPDQEVAAQATETLRTLTGKHFATTTATTNDKTDHVAAQNIAPGATVNEAILILEIDDSADMENHRYDETFSLNLMMTLTDIISPISRQEQCRFSKGIKNGIIMAFPNETNAVRFAQNTILTVTEHNRQAEDQDQINLRFSINSGTAKIGAQGDRLGVATDITTRITEIQKEQLIPIKGGMSEDEIPQKNRIFVSENVARKIQNMQGSQAKLVGLFELKGITGLHQIYSIT